MYVYPSLYCIMLRSVTSIGPLLARQDRGDAKAEVKSKRGLGTLSLKLAYTSNSAGLRKRF